MDSVLIANRGEIAVRVIRAAHELGLRTIAVYSELDRDAMHVELAAEAWNIGPAPAAESYLNIPRIIQVATEAGAHAVHPGYGFLAENDEFAQAVIDAGLIWIGPPPEAIATMGDKIASRKAAEKAGVAGVPGTLDPLASAEEIQRVAADYGYPIAIKAAHGGGGKGLKVVHSADEVERALESARREADAYFGDPEVYVEKYLDRPRHIEAQIIFDKHGNGVFLGERDCSVQRRHQKVLEEAPAPGLSEDTRKAMGEAAVRAAQAINYVGAGTVEFLYDVDGSFFFMEMNTRLQVEHPVTEMVTGQDLVEWQLKIAWGEPLPLQQSEVKTRGHALEARIYAEDPDHDFLPATGHLRYLSTPDESAHVRVDTGVTEGDDISIHYDPMIAKLIVWDETRDQAINRMVQALENYRIAGVKTNIRFLHALADAQPFREEDLTTGFIDTHRELLFPKSKLDTHKALVLAAGFVLEERKSSEPASTDPWSPFGRRNSWRLNSEYAQPLQLQVGEEIHDLKILERDDRYQVYVGDSVYNLTARLDDDFLQAVVNGHRISIHGNLHNDQLVLFYEGDTFQCNVYRETYGFEDMAGEGSLEAPMNGAIVAVQAKVGDKVTAGQTLVIMEAMKMEHAIKAPADGVVSEIFFAEGDQVAEGAELIAIDVAEEGAE